MKIYLVYISDAHAGRIRKWAGSMAEAKRIAKAAPDEYDLLTENSVYIEVEEFPTKKKALIAWLNAYADTDNG